MPGVELFIVNRGSLAGVVEAEQVVSPPKLAPQWGHSPLGAWVVGVVVEAVLWPLF